MVLPICNACNCTDSSDVISIGGMKDRTEIKSENGPSQMPDSAEGTVENTSHTIMHPSRAEVSRWMMGYKTSPSAYLSPRITAELTQTVGEHFSLLDYLKYTPSERNQGKCGNCWAWAGTGVMEIDNAYQNGVKDRLSIQYINSNLLSGSGGDWACCGGWLEDISNFYSSKMMTVPWSNTNALWKDGSRSCEDGSTSVQSSTISTDPHYDISSIDVEIIPTQGVGKDASIANIKNVLRQGKAIWFGYFLPDKSAWNNFFDFWDSQKESAVWKPDIACGRSYSDREGGGHAVLCVGYDDTNPNNRYWIMLNSWGAPSNRPNGLFLVNMDMNYDCGYPGLGNAFYWMTLNISYGDVNVNVPPAISSIPSGPCSGREKTAYTYTTSAVDPNGDQIKYTFDWGDGTISVTNLIGSGRSANATHSWDKTGDYQIKTKAIDSKGASSEWSELQTIKISKAPIPPNQPHKPTGAIKGVKGVSYRYLTLSKDPSGSKLSYIFDWGDGTTSKAGPTASGKPLFTTHKWSVPGVYQVKAMAENEDGANSDWSDPLKVKIY
ncbi:MAG: PKD domain-containing protein [Methanotrichaceae archaeon]